MSCYFLIDTYIDEKLGRGQYDDYISKAVASKGAQTIAQNSLNNEKES